MVEAKYAIEGQSYIKVDSKIVNLGDQENKDVLRSWEGEKTR